MAALGTLAEKGLSSSSSGGGFSLDPLGEAAAGVLSFEERGTSSSSLCTDTLTGANGGDVAFRGDVAWSAFIGKEIG